MESDNQMLDEVMIVAYGTAKKSAFTGSASVLKSEEIGKIQTSNAMSTLAGKALACNCLQHQDSPVSQPRKFVFEASVLSMPKVLRLLS